MLKKYLLVISIIVCSFNVKAQEITPKDLFQIYKYWQMDDAGWDKNTYDYIRTVDKQWDLRIPPQKDDNGLTLLFGFFKDKKWYQDEECRIMLTYTKKPSSNKGVMYIFTDADTWENYKKQMIVMKAQSLATQTVQGGVQSIYRVNGIDIYLTDFPPGIQGADRTYQVLITQSTH